MYTGGPQQQANTMEELWNIKPEETLQEAEKKKKNIPIISESYANPENEQFTRLHEDPLVAILKEEQRLKEQVLKNPQKMKEIQNDIDVILNGKKNIEPELKEHNSHSHHSHSHHHHHTIRKH